MKNFFLLNVSISYFFILIIILINLTSFSYSDNWFTSSGNYHSSKYSNLDQINDKNIDSLSNAWIFENGFNPSKKEFFYNNQATPIFTGKSLIVTSLDNYVISLNPETGKEIWRVKIDSPGPMARRGLTYYDKNIFVPTTNGIYVINETDGKLNLSFGNNGIIGVDKKIISLVPPIINKNKIFIIYKSFITSHELPTGKLLWKKNLNGARVWSGVSFDESENTIIFVTSNLVNLIGDTQVKNDYSNSLVLLDSLNGKTKCKFKDTLHDHWDLDMVGNPIVTKINDKKIVYGFSKTGNTFVVDINTCELLNKHSIIKIDVDDNSPIEGQFYSKYQIKVNNPSNLIDMNYDINPYLEFIKKDDENVEYVKHRTRNSKYGSEYIPLSFDYDLLMYGLHGGPEWPGGTHDIHNNQIIIPTNHYPWIIRSYYGCCIRKEVSQIKRKTYEFLTALREIKGYRIYNNKCKSCHGKNKNGIYMSEVSGDKYIPSLNGVSRLKKFSSLKNINDFNYSHKYSDKVNLNEEELKSLKRYFINRDNYLFKNNLLDERAVWQLLLDKNQNFASKPPYGKITSFSTITGEKNWEIPFGVKKISVDISVEGDINFGGLLSTKGNVTFATGTPDKKIYAFTSLNGKKLWEFKMNYSGSSPPMTYLYNGFQYIIVNSSGGKYQGYDNTRYGDMIYSFKLPQN